MASPDVDPSLFKQLLEYAWAGILALGGLVWKGLEEKLKKQDKELGIQREHIAKIFDKIESHAQRSEDRHRELMMALHEGLESKQDKTRG